MIGWKKTVIVVLSIIISTSLIAQEPAVDLSEKIKAVFIYNFTKYIDWDEADSEEFFEIGIIGKNSINESLEEIALNKQVKNKRIKILLYQDLNEIEDPEILFVSGSEENNLDNIVNIVKDKEILTIGDKTGFAGKGVAINLILVEGKIKFEVNNRVLNETGLKVSSQLLKLGIAVEDEGALVND